MLGPDGHFVRSIGRQGTEPGQFVGPHAVSVAPDGTLWVADTFNARVQHLTPGGGVLGVIKGVNGAWGVAADGSGGVYYSAYWGSASTTSTRTAPRRAGARPAPARASSRIRARWPSRPRRHAATRSMRATHACSDVGGRIAGQRGSADPGASGLTDPVAVSVARDGSVVVLDAARKRLVSYVGSAAGGFSSVAAQGVPLAIAADANGAMTVAACGQWSGGGRQYAVKAS